MTLLIGLNGFKGSGKNTAGEVIRRWGERRGLVVITRAFAELLKLSAARSLGLYSATSINDAVVLMDSLKVSGVIDIAIPEQSIMKSISGREFLKWFGTEGHRDVFGTDFWVDQILPHPQSGQDWTHYWVTADDDPCDIAVVTDLRFANEARRVKELGGVIWNIHRPNYEEDGHISEQPLPQGLVDLVIENDSSIEAFDVAVNTQMTADYHMRFVPMPMPEFVGDEPDDPSSPFERME